MAGRDYLYRTPTVMEGVLTTSQIQATSRLLVLPPAAQRFIKLNDTQNFIALQLRQRQFGLKQVAIGIESVELSIHSAPVPHIRQPFPVLERHHLLMNPALPRSLMGD